MTKKIIIGVIVAIVLGVGYYGISPIFRHVRVDELAPQAKDIPSNSHDVSSGESIQKQDQMMREPVSTVVGTGGHPGSGSVRVINTEGGTVVRYENFKTINGHDLYVYLAKDLDAKEYVNLGTLKATEGNVNYDVPADVNVSDYRYVMVWCKQFSVLFNYADLFSKQ